MRLIDLHRALGELVEAGYGDRLVIDNSGNDVTAVYPQLLDESQATDVRLDDDRRAVMLSAHIDHDLRASLAKISRRVAQEAGG